MSSEEVINPDDPRFRITPLQQIGASCIGALVTSMIMTPFDVVKIRLQSQQKANLSSKCFLYCNGLMDHLCTCPENGTASSQSQWYRRPGQFNGTLDAFAKIAKNEGIASLWSGLSPTLVLAIPTTVIYFVTYEQMRVRLKDYYNLRINSEPSNQVQPTWIPLLSGASARTWAVTIVSPLELVRTKMQSKRLTYRETGQAVKSLIAYEGIFGLWKGLGPTLMRDVPFSAIYWLNYEALKNTFSQKNPTFGFSFLAGSIAGSIAAIITVPFDVVKTYQQIEMGEKQICKDPPCRTSSGYDVMKDIIKVQGFRGLFTGVVPRVCKVAPACAIMISSYEYGKSFFQLYNKSIFLQSMNAELTLNSTQDLRTQSLRR
ncbi:solute carrier family 25 member 40-like [Ischnura elegans]|uniref:solute carrier family 25 member 40-like n=1 Tax=Ischnura elegans TaxID=197161 RepID=UPI001ED88B82|nr:solute carrier family 25 member 40-like [Ischnura elegans]